MMGGFMQHMLSAGLTGPERVASLAAEPDPDMTPLCFALVQCCAPALEELVIHS
jgi:hypothetical protein